LNAAILKKLPFLFLVIGSLISGILTGWFRLGMDMPVSQIYLHHGALMTGSFLGTVILLERIVTLKKNCLFIFPLVNGSSLFFYYLDMNTIAFSCLILGSVGLFYVFYLIIQQHEDLPFQVMWVGAGAWFIGNVHLLIFQSYAHSILWWMGFLLLTIVGERLELSKFLPISRLKGSVLLALLALFLLSCVIPFHLGGQVLTGFALVGIAIWLLLYDMVRKSIRKAGIHHFTALSLMFGYIWLAISGILYMANGGGSIAYDALIHSFFLGFVFSMIFAHGPIILPCVLGLNFKPYHKLLYLWLVLFEFSLAARLTGSFWDFAELKTMAGFANGVFILLYFASMIWLVLGRNFKFPKNIKA
jgi:hypothetical protein